MPIVTMPDGAHVQFPDDMPPEQIKGLIAQKFPDAVKKLDPGFVDRVNADFAQRDVNMKRDADAGVNGDQTTFETLAQTGMENASKLTDIGKEAINSIPGASTVLPLAGKAIVRGVETMYGISPEAVDSSMQQIGDLLAAHPRIARDLGVVGQGLGVYGAATGLRSAADLAMGSGNAMETAAAKLEANPPAAPAPALASQAKAGATEGYDLSKWMGGKFAPTELGDKVDSTIENLKPKQLPNGKFTAEQNQLSAAMDEFSGHAGKEVGLDDLNNIDQAITDKMNSPAFRSEYGELNGNGQKLRQLQLALRSAADSADVSGNDALANGRTYWGAYRKLSDLDAIAYRAKFAKNPAEFARNKYVQMLTDPEEMRGWTPEAKALLEQAADPSIGGKILDLPLKMASAMGIGTGDFATGLGANLADMVSKSAKGYVLGKRVSDVQERLFQEAIDKERPVDVGDLSAQLRLPAPGKGTPIDPDKMPLPAMNDAQVSIAQKLMQRGPAGGDDTSGAAIRVGTQKMLPAPGKATPLTEGMSDPQVTIAQRLMSKAPAEGDDTSGTAIKGGVPSRLEQLKSTLKGAKAQQFEVIRHNYETGAISQNEFVSKVGGYGLSTKQARSLAQEIKTSGGN